MFSNVNIFKLLTEVAGVQLILIYLKMDSVLIAEHLSNITWWHVFTPSMLAVAITCGLLMMHSIKNKIKGKTWLAIK